MLAAWRGRSCRRHQRNHVGRSHGEWDNIVSWNMGSSTFCGRLCQWRSISHGPAALRRCQSTSNAWWRCLVVWHYAVALPWKFGSFTGWPEISGWFTYTRLWGEMKSQLVVWEERWLFWGSRLVNQQARFWQPFTPTCHKCRIAMNEQVSRRYCTPT